MVFHMPQKKVPLPQLNIAGMAIEFVSNFNFLGIKIDTNLNWLSHTNLVANTILKTAGVLNKLRVLTTIYFSLIQCHLNYGILAWGHLTHRLFKLQKRILRIITCSPYISHTAQLFKKLGILKLNNIYTLQQLKFYYKLLHLQLPNYFYKMSYLTNIQTHGSTLVRAVICICLELIMNLQSNVFVSD